MSQFAKKIINTLLISTILCATGIFLANPTHATAWSRTAYEAVDEINLTNSKGPYIGNGYAYIIYQYYSGSTYKLKLKYKSLSNLYSASSSYGLGWSTVDLDDGSRQFTYDAVVDTDGKLHIVFQNLDESDIQYVSYLDGAEESSDSSLATTAASGYSKLAIDAYQDDFLAIAAKYVNSANECYIKRYIVSISSGSVTRTDSKLANSSCAYFYGGVDIAFSKTTEDDVAIVYRQANSSSSGYIYFWSKHGSTSNYTTEAIGYVPLLASDGRPAVAIVSDSDGNFHVAYEDTDSSSYTINYYKCDIEGDRLDSNTIVSSSSYDYMFWSGSFIIDASDNLYLSYSRYPTGTSSNFATYYRKSTDSFDTSTLYSVSNTESRFLGVFVDDQDSLHIAYNEDDGTYDTIYYSGDDNTDPPSAEENSTYMGNHFNTDSGDYYTADTTPTVSWSSEADYFSGLDYFKLFLKKPGSSSFRVSGSTIEASSASSYNRVLTSEAVDEGRCDWYIKTYDNHNNTSTSEIFSVYIDSSKPETYALTLEAAYFQNGNVPRLSGPAVNYGLVTTSEPSIGYGVHDPNLQDDSDGSGLVSAILYQNLYRGVSTTFSRSGYTDSTTIVSSYQSGSSGGWANATTSLPDGWHYFEMDLEDAVSNTSREGIACYIDTYDPAITITSSSGATVAYSSTTTYNLQGIASDINTTANNTYSGIKSISSALYSGSTATGRPLTSETLYDDSSTTWNYNNTASTESFNKNFSVNRMGDYTIKITVVDFAGHITNQTYNFSVADLTAPTVRITSPSTGEVFDTNQCTTTFTARDTGGTGVRSLLLKTQQGSTVNYTTLATTETGAALTGLLEGSLVITVIATDESGNTGSASREVTIDLPDLEISYPTTGDTLTSSVATVEFNNPFIDSGSALVYISAEATKSGGSRTTYDMADLGLATREARVTSEVSFDINLTEGNYLVTVYARDTAGNAKSDSVRFTVNLPDLLIASPADRETVTDSVVTFTVWNPVAGSANNLSDLNFIFIDDDGREDEYDMGDLSLSARDIAREYITFEVSFTEGNRIATVEAEDSVGNTFSDVVRFTVALDDIEFNRPTTRTLINTSTVTCEVTNPYYGSDNALDDFEIKVTSNGGRLNTYDAGDLSISDSALQRSTISFNLTSLSDGRNNITAEVADSLGNESSNSVDVLIDTTKPDIIMSAVTVATDETSTSLTWTPTIVFTASDTNEAANEVSGIATLEVDIYSGSATSGSAVFRQTYYSDSTRTFGRASTYREAVGYSDELDELAITDSAEEATYTVVYTAIDFAGNTTTETQTFTITPNPIDYINDIKFAPSTITLEAGQETDLSAYIYGYHGTDAFTLEATDVDWVCGDTALGTVDANGNFTSLGTEGSLTVTASINGYSADMTIDIIASTLASISLSASTNEVYNGETATFSIVGLDTYGNPVSTDLSAYPFSWGIDASAGSLSVSRGDYDNATFTAENAGTYTLYATYESSSLGTLTASFEITVSEIPVASIEVSGSTSLTAGQTYTMSAVAYGTDGTQISDLSIYTFTWSVTSGATISATTGSSVTLTAGSAAGTVTLSLACDYASTLTNEATLTISADDASALSSDPDLSSGDYSITYGETETITVTASDEYGNATTSETITLDSTDTTDGALYGVNTVEVTVDGVTETYTYYVTPSIESMTLSSTDEVLSQGQSITLSLSAVDSRSGTLSLSELESYGVSVSWSASGGSISDSGVFTAPSVDGSYTITVTIGSVSTTLTLEVSSGGPTITVTINDEEYSSSDSNIIDADADIEITVTDTNEVVYSSISISVDDSSVAAANVTIAGASTSSASTYDVSLASTILSSLSDGEHTMVISATDATGASSSKSVTFSVYTSLDVIGTPFNYPNPFSPADGVSTTIRYSLSQSADIIVMLYDITGNRIWRYAYASGSEGGNSGQNEISWNGYTDFGSRAGNGVYIYFIMSGGAVLGSGEIAVYN